MKLNNDVYKVFIGEEAFTIITNCFKKEAFNNEQMFIRENKIFLSKCLQYTLVDRYYGHLWDRRDSP